MNINFDQYLKKDDVNHQLGATVLALAVNGAGLVIVVGTKLLLDAATRKSESSEDAEETTEG